jgi:hypothetical protein
VRGLLKESGEGLYGFGAADGAIVSGWEHYGSRYTYHGYYSCSGRPRVSLGRVSMRGAGCEACRSVVLMFYQHGGCRGQCPIKLCIMYGARGSHPATCWSMHNEGRDATSASASDFDLLDSFTTPNMS